MKSLLIKKQSPLPRLPASFLEGWERVRVRVTPTIKSILILFLLLLPFSAAAQTPLQKMGSYTEAFGEEKPFAQGFYEKAAQHQADPQWVMEVLGRAKLMRDQGLPTEPLFLKASEGLTKKVPASRILPALDHTQKQTETAGRLVDQAVARGALVGSPQAKREAVLNYQRALLNEVPPSSLQKLSDSVDPRSSSKIKIEELGKAAREIPKMKKEGLSDDEALGKVEKTLKEKGIAEKKMEVFENGVREEKVKKHPKEKEWKKEEKGGWKEMKPEKQKDSFPKGGGPSISSPGKGHGKGK